MEKQDKQLWQTILFALAITALFWYFFVMAVGCKTIKQSVNVRDSVVLVKKDSVVFKTRIKDSTVTFVKDTLVRVKYDRAEYSFNAGDTKDTAVRSGRATLRKSVNNGVVTIQADCDSFDILITDMRLIIQQKNDENERINTAFAEYKSTHNSEVLKEKEQGGFGKLWGKVRNVFAWIGLLAVLYLIYKLIRRVKPI